MEYLQGFGLRGFRNYASIVKIGPLGKVNCLAGQNNSGKTNLLSFISRYLRSASSEVTPPQGLDIPRSGEGEPFEIILAVSPEKLVSHLVREDRRQEAAPFFRTLLRDPALADGSGEFSWLRLQRNNPSGNWEFPQAQELVAQDSHSAAAQLARIITGSHYPSINPQNMSDALQRLDLKAFVPPVREIAPLRQIRSLVDDDVADEILDGRDLVRRLSRLQHADAGDEDDELVFEAIVCFLRDILEDDALQLDIPHSLNTINISLGGRPKLPLERHGLGVQQIVIMATMIHAYSDCLFLIEEPEVNLHPLMQRKFARHLESTNNQYILTTHSAHTLDYAKSSVFHIQRSDNTPSVMLAKTAEEAFTLCYDLGYRSSDLIQSNCIVWVEGPSDRIYLKYAIDAATNREFEEGINYSIMIYGGSLLSSLSASDPVVEEFISLRRLNRFMAVIMDSDRKSGNQPISDAKNRIIREFDESSRDGLAWLTWGYTFENYLPPDVLTSAVKAVHPRTPYEYTGRRYTNPLPGSGFDKIAIAREVCDRWSGTASNKRSDFMKSLLNVVDMIREANSRA